MEYQNTDSKLFDFNYNDNLRIQLRGAAVWAGIAALLSMVGAGIGAISSFLAKPEPIPTFQREGFDNSLSAGAQQASTIFGAIFGLAIAFLFFYFLNRFATLTKRGLNGNNPDQISSGIGSLSTYFIIIGVFVILALVGFLVVMAGVAVGISR